MYKTIEGMKREAFERESKRNPPASQKTLRDEFAGMAMQGLLSNPKLADEIKKHGGAHLGWIEETAWAWADSMLKHRGNV